MQYSIITPNNFNTIKWSGGTSTELLIYPSNSDYQQRNFDFRLSTATVEVEKSDFTPLPGVSRKLMILDGEIEISHENHYTKKLAKFDIDSFEGDWKTSSVGKCIDFNLMTRGNATGEISALSLEKNQATKLALEKNLSYFILYVSEGEISINIDDKYHLLQQGNMLTINQLIDSELQLTGITDCDLIISQLIL